MNLLSTEMREALERERAKLNGSGPDEDAAAGAPGKSKPSQATLLVALAKEGAALFSSPDGTAFATVAVGNHRETWPLRSKRFRTWLARGFYQSQGKAPGAQALHDATGVLEGEALFGGEERDVAVRLAGSETTIYVDLGDATWGVVEIDATGWRVLEDPPARMRRPRGLAALAHPERGGSISELRRFVNVASEADWRLLVAWLVGALRPQGPYPLLVLHGEHGTAKSTVARLLRSLIDPNAAPLRADPREPRDLMIAATNGWITAFDNLSRVQPWLSDALCRLSTGGGFATRELYSDTEETIFEAQRPTILTGIEELATRGDLLDRAIILYLPRIEHRRSERELWIDFAEARPRILGAILGAASCAIRELPRVTLDGTPRMADFAEWVTAAEPTLPWEPGGFLRAYEHNRGAANELTLEASPIAEPLRLLADHEQFAGTATDLLARLAEIADDAVSRRESWPKTPQALSGALRRIAPNLRDLGILIEFAKGTKGRRRVVVRKVAQYSATIATSAAEAGSKGGAGGAGGDDSHTSTSAMREAGEAA